MDCALNIFNVYNLGFDLFYDYRIYLYVCIVLTLVIIIYNYCKFEVCKFNAYKALNTAIAKGDIISCIKIIEKYPDTVNTRNHKTGYSPFLKACLYGNTQLVKYMIKNGADLSLTTNRRESAFYLATYNRICNPESTDMSCLYVLYYAGADKDLPNANGFTPLQLAAVFGHTSLARWLLARGCSTTVFPKPALLARSQGHLLTASTLNELQVKALMEL